MADLERPDGLVTVWKILDRAHEQMEHERADDAYGAWEQARRKPGQTIDEWLTYLRTTKLEVETQDSTVVISDKPLANKILITRSKSSPRQEGASLVQLWWRLRTTAHGDGVASELSQDR